MDNDENSKIAKGDAGQNQESDGSWPCVGLPSCIVMDNGKPLISKPNGWFVHKGVIERFFKTNDLAFLWKLPQRDEPKP